MPNDHPLELADKDRFRTFWVCDVCGLRFVNDRFPFVRCIKLHHCHAGDLLACDDGTEQYAVKNQDCEIVSVISFE